MVQKEVREVDRGHIVRSLDASCQLRLLIQQVTEHPIHTGLKKRNLLRYVIEESVEALWAGLA